MARSFSLQVNGVDQLNRALSTFAASSMPDTVGAYLYRLAQEILAKSLELCPVDTGALRRSGQVQGPTRDMDVVSVAIGYGDTAVDYAIIVHEDLTAYHDPPTQAKFLEQPVLEAAPKVEQSIKFATQDAAERLRREAP